MILERGRDIVFIFDTDIYTNIMRKIPSLAVIEELERGEYPNKENVIGLLDDVPILTTPIEIVDIVDTYISRQLMPADTKGVALHLALASYHNCDFLLTWNCQHLANANKFAHIRRIMSTTIPNLPKCKNLTGFY